VSIWLTTEPHAGQNYKYEISHSMRTPMQSDPYYPGSPYSHSPADALQKAICDLTHYYSSAISAGYQPAENWLVSNIRQCQGERDTHQSSVQAAITSCRVFRFWQDLQSDCRLLGSTVSGSSMPTNRER
jgi:hypothetical protein